MKIIGVTGGVGAGKSAILSYLEESYGAKVVLADQVSNLLKEPGQSCYQPIIDLLGNDILQEDGIINRKEMGNRIFTNEKLLASVNEIIHPAVKTYILSEIEEERKKGRQLFVVEAALLLEAHYEDMCDEVWYIYTEESIRRQRLKESRGYSDEYISHIMEKQLSEENFRQQSDFVIDNSGTLESTKKQIDQRIQRNEIM